MTYDVQTTPFTEQKYHLFLLVVFLTNVTNVLFTQYAWNTILGCCRIKSITVLVTPPTLDVLGITFTGEYLPFIWAQLIYGRIPFTASFADVILIG